MVGGGGAAGGAGERERGREGGRQGATSVKAVKVHRRSCSRLHTACTPTLGAGSGGRGSLAAASAAAAVDRARKSCNPHGCEQGVRVCAVEATLPQCSALSPSPEC